MRGCDDNKNVKGIRMGISRASSDSGSDSLAGLSYTVLVYDSHLRQGATSDRVLKLLWIYVVCRHLGYGPISVSAG